MLPKDLEPIVAFFKDRPLLAILLLPLWYLVRLLRDDVRFLPDLKGPNRMAAALVLGIFAGELERLQSGVSFKEAAINGLFLGIAAIGVQLFGVDLARGGKEVPVPGFLLKEKEKKDPPSSPPPASSTNVPGPFPTVTGAALILLAAIAGTSLVACAASKLPKLTPADYAELGAHDFSVEAKLKRCQDEGRALGRDAGGRAAYEACKADAGLR